jgi:hypothetical protein
MWCRSTELKGESRCEPIENGGSLPIEVTLEGRGKIRTKTVSQENCSGWPWKELLFVCVVMIRDLTMVWSKSLTVCMNTTQKISTIEVKLLTNVGIGLFCYCLFLTWLDFVNRGLIFSRLSRPFTRIWIRIANPVALWSTFWQWWNVHYYGAITDAWANW